MTIYKPTSLKHYLFGITVILVLLLTAVQLTVFHYVENQIQDEIEQRSRALSDVAVSVLNKQVVSRAVVENDDFPTSTPNSAVRLIVESRPGYEVDLGDGYILQGGEDTKVIRVLPENITQEKVLMKTNSDTEVPHVALTRVGDSFRVALADKPNQLISQHIVQFDQHNSVVADYFDWIILATLLLMSLLLVYFYWLAGKVSMPLRLLGAGFQQLEKGELGAQITESGVDEVRYTLGQFNQMSQRLEELNKQEREWQQQQQLVEIHEVSKGLAHTLRNPLNTIGLAVEQIAQDGVNSEKREQLAKSIRQKINNLDKTIKMMLRLNSHDLKRDTHIGLAAVITDLMMEFSSDRGPNIIFQNDDPDAQIKASESEIRAIIHSILSNAVEASEPDQTITLTLREEENRVSIQVADNGVGIEGKDIDELFKPHTSHKAEGAGMGLFLAQRISRAYYKGDIQLQPNEPNGCLAIITLHKE